MAKVDLFISKSPLASGAAQMPFVDTGANTAAINPALYASTAQQIAITTNKIGAVFQAKRDLEVRAAHASYMDQVRDNAAAEAFRAKDPGAPLTPVYEQTYGHRTMVQQDGHSTYSSNIAQFNRRLLAGIDDTKVQKLVAASIPSALRATDWDVASHYRARQIDALFGARIEHNENIRDGLTAILSLPVSELSTYQIAQAREYLVAFENMHRSLADDGFITHELAATEHETAFNSLAKNIFKGAIQHAFHKGATIVTDDGVDVVQTPELLRLRDILSSEENVQRYGAELADRLDLPEPMILQLETDDRIALLGEVDTQINKVKSEYREDVKFRQQQSDRARDQRHDTNRRAIIGLFGRQADMTDAQRQQFYADFAGTIVTPAGVTPFIPSGTDGSITQDDIDFLERHDFIGSDFAKDMRVWKATGFEGDQDWNVYVDFKAQIANADIGALPGIQNEIISQAGSLGPRWTSQLIGDIESRRTRTPSSEAHARAEATLIKRLGGMLGTYSDAKVGATSGSALQRYRDQTRDPETGAIIEGLDYDAIARSIFTDLVGVSTETLQNEIRPVTANVSFQIGDAETWVNTYTDKGRGIEINNQANMTLQILSLLESGTTPRDLIKRYPTLLVDAGMSEKLAAQAKHANNASDLKRLMGIPPHLYTTKSSIDAARRDLMRLQNLRMRYLATQSGDN